MMIVLDAFSEAGELLEGRLASALVHPDRRSARGERESVADVRVHAGKELGSPPLTQAIIDIQSVGECLLLRPEQLRKFVFVLIDIEQSVEHASVHGIARDLGMTVEPLGNGAKHRIVALS